MSSDKPLLMAQTRNQVATVPQNAKARLEIDEFIADNDMTNLFLLALAEMQTEDKSKGGKAEDWWTFYSLSGTHSSIQS